MASALSSAFGISDEERRWAVIGVCLTKVLTPALRNVLATEVQKWYHLLCQPPDDIDKQVFTKHKKKLSPSKFQLKYENINNNNAHKSPRAYDYAVKDPLSLAKLFVQPFMSLFTGFDETMDMSAVLTVMCEADPFISSGAAVEAKTVRSDIRNKWAHCNFSEWTKPAFNAAFQGMDNLVKKMNLSPVDEKALCDVLDSWKVKGLQLCFGQPVDVELLKLVTNEVTELHKVVEKWKFESDTQINTLLEQLGNIKSKLDQELRDLLGRMERCEKQGAENSKEIKRLDKTFHTGLSKLYTKQEEKIPYVFSAPARNQYFSGRDRELQELRRILQNDDVGQDKVCTAAICGMGGIGKTSLITEYAHQMEMYYKGGVYWFSAEDDSFLERSVNDIALQLDALLGNFDLTLTNTLIKIGKTREPCLIVLDCLDQLNLSPNVLRFLLLVTRRSFSGAVVLVTRRNENLLVDEIQGLHKDRCLTLKCFEVEEAKNFVFKKTSLTTPDESTRSVAETLVEELGRLPLALEQAGACIRVLRCSLSNYLEQYKTEHLKLLEKRKANPSSPYESPERVAVHTTWLLNIKHIKESPDGIHAIRFMNACAFLNPNEIEEELVNVGERPVEDKAFRDYVSSPVGRRQVVALLTDFSLFTYVHVHSVSTHRLVQELVRENLDPEDKAKSFVAAVRMLCFAFSKCESPKSLLGWVGDEERLSSSDLLKNRSNYYLWSKLCFHGFHLQKNLEKLLAKPDPKCLDSLLFNETAQILYECAVHLSAYQKQEEAKRTVNFAYRVLDWIPPEEYDTIHKCLSDNSLFPPVIPLPKWLQVVIKQCCVPPVSSLESLDEKPRVVAESSESRDLKQNIEELRLEGNWRYKEGYYKDAIEAYSSAINMSRGTTAFNPLLLTNRASAYINLSQLDDALSDANEYILQRPGCWKGYARKALALNNEKVSAEIAAALAHYFYLKDGRCIFSEYPPFASGAFPGLKERIWICDTVNQLIAALPFFAISGALRVIILGSKEYIINSSLPSMLSSTMMPVVVSNCILVGTKPDSSVSLKLEGIMGLTLVGQCMFVNLCFSIDKGQIKTTPDSFVKVLNCNFTSRNDESAAVASEGAFNAEHCHFSNCKAGGLLCVGPGNMVVDRCTFSHNVKAGLEVRANGKLTVRNSRMYNNCFDGLLIGPNAAECDVLDCQIYHNSRGGITAADDSKHITLIKNHVFGNDENGIFVRNSDVDMRENMFYDNESWGIWSQTNSWCNVSMNKIFRNKRGGLRVGQRLAGKGFSPSVVELNEIHDNYGPGYIDTINQFEDFSLLGKIRASAHFLSSRDYKSAKYDGNLEYNNEERITANRSKLSSSWCSGCFGKCENLKRCGKCFTAAYCNANCQRRHWSKHKKLCKVLREKSSFLINSMTRHGFDGSVNVHAEGLDEVGPKYSPPPPRNGKKFIVKVQTYFEISQFQPYTLIIYDRSLEVYETFRAKIVDQIVKEFGVLCERKYQEKKLFLDCVFEENGKLRLFIHDFAEFQKW